MKKKTKSILKNVAKNLIHLKYVRLYLFAKKLNISSIYLSRSLNSDNTYIHTLLDYILECDAKLIVTVKDRDGINMLNLTSLNAEEIAKKLGIVCRAEIIKRFNNIKSFAEFMNKRKTDIYAILNAKNKASIDHLIDLFEVLEVETEIKYEL